MAGMRPKHQRYGTWVYKPIGAALEMVGLEEIEVYIARRHNTVARYIATRPIMDLCLAEERKPGMCLTRRLVGAARPGYTGDKGRACSIGGGGGTGVE